MNNHNQTGKLDRRSVRLKDFDYTQPGFYFITICTFHRQNLFGQYGETSPLAPITVVLNTFGEIASQEWTRSSSIRSEIILDEFIILPDHVHGIVQIQDVKGTMRENAGDQPVAPTARLKPHSLAAFIGGYKSSVTRKINQVRHDIEQPVWQRGFYEHIVRNDDELNHIREYVRFNPSKLEQYR